MKLLPCLLVALTQGADPFDPAYSSSGEEPTRPANIHENQPPLQQGDITLSSDSSDYNDEYSSDLSQQETTAVPVPLVVTEEPVLDEESGAPSEPAPAPVEPQPVVIDPTVVRNPEPASVTEEEDNAPVDVAAAVDGDAGESQVVDNSAPVEEPATEEDLVSAPSVAEEPETSVDTALPSKKEANDDDKKGPRPSPKQNLPETPDLVIAVDIASLDESKSTQLRDFVKDIVSRLNQDYKIGGCLDELRIGIFEHDSDHVNILVRGSDYNTFLGTRKSCMEADSDPDFIANDLLSSFDENWVLRPVEQKHEHVAEHGGEHDNETEENQATHMFLHSKAMLDSWKNERKGQVWRRLHRWNFSTRKVIVFVHDAEDSAEFYKGLGIQGKELGYEIIPVAISDDMDAKTKLHQMALKTQRSGPLPAITLDIGMEESARVISQYLSSTAVSKPYTAPLPSE
ncbi:Oidioi.mRNA.OKI2018_I69.chr2.g8335.t1.cds [Oikopleura dioica]|uniref:Oidioi.mRNA.OKI2018_I69.chr2.g8335.t1.cds n=1 Tax=Oikopleura dioica TaxID=34765 RepID=A0ABN7T9E4_OIKDI|nr:Oidioi.mRNA.OKI2018_I69.chr2.g8335.t1.cds [Oikopleura dioica]